MVFWRGLGTNFIFGKRSLLFRILHDTGWSAVRDPANLEPRAPRLLSQRLDRRPRRPADGQVPERQGDAKEGAGILVSSTTCFVCILWRGFSVSSDMEKTFDCNKTTTIQAFIRIRPSHWTFVNIYARHPARLQTKLLMSALGKERAHSPSYIERANPFWVTELASTYFCCQWLALNSRGWNWPVLHGPFLFISSPSKSIHSLPQHGCPQGGISMYANKIVDECEQ